jgi:adenylate kinase family enzyme
MRDKKPIKLFILFGPPGAGKTTQSLLLQEKLGWHYISWGKISREIMNNYGKYKSCYAIVKKLTEENKPFPPGFVANILDQEIKSLLKNNKEVSAIIMDGFPRRLSEAHELLDIMRNNGLYLDSIIKFNVNFETIKQQINERMFCPKCGRFYNPVLKPKKEGYCDADGTRLIKRPDDYLEILKDRFDVYMEESLDAFNFLTKYAVNSYNVNADQDPISLFAEIISKLKTRNKINYQLYHKVGQTKLMTEFGEFNLIGYQNKINYDYHLVLVKGDVKNKRAVPLRIHSACITGDIFQSKKCDCGKQLQKSLELINKNGLGLVIYLF